YVGVNYVGRPEGAEATKEAIEHGVKSCVDAVHAAGARALLVEADVSDAHEVDQMYKQVTAEFGPVDFLVNNAGIQIAKPSEDLDAESFDRVLAVNLRGAFLCAQRQIRHLLEAGRPGSIVNVSSVHQIIPKPQFLGYSVSKGGMQNLTRTLALEYAGRGIRVNAVGPGATVTPINRAWIEDPEKRALVTAHIPMGRAGSSEEMAAVTAFLGREFTQRLGAPEGGIGGNQVGWVVEQVTAPSQIGTHMDGLNHLRIGDRSYNGFRLDDIAEEWGTNRLGVETLPQVVTRGL